MNNRSIVESALSHEGEVNFNIIVQLAGYTETERAWAHQDSLEVLKTFDVSDSSFVERVLHIKLKDLPLLHIFSIPLV